MGKKFRGNVAANGRILFAVGSVIAWAMIANGTHSAGQPVTSPDGLVQRIVPTGSVIPFAGEQIPPGWLECNGQVVKTAEHPELAECLKGGAFWDGKSDTFTVPDLSGRMTIGAGRGKGLTTRKVGESDGAETHKLTVAEMPSHGHPISDKGHSHAQNVSANPGTGQKQAIRLDWNGDTDKNPAGYYSQGIPTNPSKTGITVGDTGSGRPHNNMPPFLVLRHIIKD